MEPHKIVSEETWTAARKKLLAKEKELTRARDRLSAERRKLPWVKVEKKYVFDTTEGRKTLADLFEGRSQLIVQHFMFGPDWEEGCPGCSFEADHVDAAYQHVRHHDVTLCRGRAGAAGQARSLPEAHGLAVPAGCRPRAATSTTIFTCPSPRRTLTKGKVYYNFAMDGVPDERSAGQQRLLQGRGRRHLPHLFIL